MSTWINLRFPEIRQLAAKDARCADCGHRVRRQRVFSQMLSPFNKDDLGKPKTSDQIIEELQGAVAVWQDDPVWCSNCR